MSGEFPREDRREGGRRIPVARTIFAVSFIVAGITHFAKMGLFVQMVPTFLPWPRALVLVSGAAEIMLGSMLLFPKTQRVAAWGIIALLVAVFPANVNMALNPELFPTIKPLFLWIRLPLQAVLVSWVWRYTKR